MNTKVNEGKLISGKEALITWVNKIPLEYTSDALGEWFDVNNSNTLGIFERSDFKFRLKPRTITINGIEMPAPAEDEDYHHQGIWILNSLEPKEYGYVVLDITDELPRYWWRTEEEIKQVVAALRSIFNECN